MNNGFVSIVFASLVITSVYGMQEENFEKYKIQAMIEQLKQEAVLLLPVDQVADLPVAAYVGSAETPVKKKLYIPRFANSAKKQLFKNHEEQVAAIEAQNGPRPKKLKKLRYAR